MSLQFCVAVVNQERGNHVAGRAVACTFPAPLCSTTITASSQSVGIVLRTRLPYIIECVSVETFIVLAVIMYLSLYKNALLSSY